MEDLVQRGLTRAIGISNFSITKTEKLLKTAKIVPAANQVELHAYFQQPKLREYCDSKGEKMCSLCKQAWEYYTHSCTIQSSCDSHCVL